VREVGTGTPVFDAPPVRGRWMRLGSPVDILTLMDNGATGVVAVVEDAGATFLAPIFEDLAAVVCLSGTPLSHIGIVSREYEVPCLMGTSLNEEPEAGTTVEVDCSAGAIRC
jgi:signal transduction protein with GAF and PtsI domain